MLYFKSYREGLEDIRSITQKNPTQCGGERIVACTYVMYELDRKSNIQSQKTQRIKGAHAAHYMYRLICPM